MVYKCMWHSFLKSISIEKSKELSMHTERLACLNCEKDGAIYVGIKTVDVICDQPVEGIGAVFCKQHAVRVITIMKRMGKTDDSIESFPVKG